MSWTRLEPLYNDGAVGTPERSDPSRRLHQAAVAERTRLEARLREVDETLNQLSSELSTLEREREQIEGRLGLLIELTGEASQPRPFGLVSREPADTPSDAPRGVLRGSAIRQVAVRILASRQNPLEPIRYTDWYALVKRSGYEVNGRKPLATFLTQVSRSPVVIKASEPGTYALDLSAPTTLHEQLGLLNDELSALHEGQQVFERITSVRTRREQLLREIGRVERSLLEAVDSLGLDAEDRGPPERTAM